jgi:hypothetical protein
MLTEWTFKEQRVKNLTIIPVEADEEDDQKTGGGIV